MCLEVRHKWLDFMGKLWIFFRADLPERKKRFLSWAGDEKFAVDLNFGKKNGILVATGPGPWQIELTSRGGSRVVQVICTNHSNFFQILFISSLLLLTKSIILLVLLFIMKLIKQLRDYSVDHTANPAPPERSGRVTVRAVSCFVDLSRTTRKKIRRHDRTKFLPRG